MQLAHILRFVHNKSKVFMRQAGRRLKMLRGDLSQKELARKLGVSQAAIYQYEHGKTFPHFEVEQTISRIFGVTRDWILEGVGRKPKFHKPKNVRFFLSKHGFPNIRALSKRAKISYSHLSAVLSGQRHSIKLEARLIAILKCSLSDLKSVMRGQKKKNLPRYKLQYKEKQ